MLKYFTNAISRALGFTKTESRGTLVLIFIIFIAIISSRLRINYLKNTSPIVQDSSAIEWIQKVQASYDLKESQEVKFEKSNYLLAKSEFGKKKDDSSIKSTRESKLKKEKYIPIKDLNKATSEDLQTVHGIGPSFSERITKYRNLLGGFADTTQLAEVYGLKPETINELLKHFRIESNVIPISINSDSIKVLASHPYISYNLARIIINYRKEHGDIKSSEDLAKIKAIDERTLLRLKPYLE